MPSDKYADFITLNPNYKDVFNLEMDFDKEALWKRYIYTNSFETLLSDLQFLFSDKQQSERKGIVLTGMYGVGKSHTIGVLSHLLWDHIDTIDDMLEKAVQKMNIIGKDLVLFRKNARYFPVVLTGSDSINIRSADEFKLKLQVALDRALKKFGFYEKIDEELVTQKYRKWLINKQENDDPFLEIISKYLEDSNTGYTVDDLIGQLSANNAEAIKIIEHFFVKNSLGIPYDLDTREYYKKVLKKLRDIDPSISGIIIYWDEFTTVFHNIGKRDDHDLLKIIEEWAEFAYYEGSSPLKPTEKIPGIYLFLISHIGPQGLMGKYSSMSNEFGKIDDRFSEIKFEMENITAYHLITDSIQISNPEKREILFTKTGLNKVKLDNIHSRSKEIFPYDFSIEQLDATIPFHFYSIYVAGKIAFLIGSAERSIFQLINSSLFEKTIYGSMAIGFSKFIQIEPNGDKFSWYDINHVFDFFYKDLISFPFDPVSEINVITPLQEFQSNHDNIKRKNEHAFLVYKAIVLLEMMNAKTNEQALLPSQRNLEHAFYFTDLESLDENLKLLTDEQFIRRYESDGKGGVYYKTNHSGGISPSERIKIREKEKNAYPFKKFVSSPDLQVDIIKKFGSTITDSGRVALKNIKIISYPASEFEDSVDIIEKEDADGYASIILLIPFDTDERSRIFDKVRSLSSKCSTKIFALYEGDFGKIYDHWIDARTSFQIGVIQKNESLKRESEDQKTSQLDRFINNLTHITLFYNGQQTQKINGPQKEINQYLQKIFNRGFDYLSYNQLWGNPKDYSKLLLQYYDDQKGKESIEDAGQIQKRILDVFSDVTQNQLLNSELLFKTGEFVERSPQHEIVKKIHEYIDKETGKWISIRSMIDELELEKTPYGLCGWIESIIITYAIAPYYHDNRLETQLGNQATSKDASEIVKAINYAIKNKDAGQKLRSGKEIETQIANKLKNIFNIDTNSNTLFEIVVQIREKINSQFGIPLWLAPYTEENEKNKKLLDICIKNLNIFIHDVTDEKTFTDENIQEIIDLIKQVEKKKTPGIWTKSFSASHLDKALMAYVNSVYPDVGHIYSDPQKLKKLISIEIGKDPWLWDQTDVPQALAKISKYAGIPNTPQNVTISYETEGVVLTWSAPSSTDPYPSEYLIERSDNEVDSFSLLKTISSNTTRYVDVNGIAGKTYNYRIIAQNPIGHSDPSQVVSQIVLAEPPSITVEVFSESDNICLKWVIPEPEEQYRIQKFNIYRGLSSKNLEKIAEVDHYSNFYQDYSIETEITFYYAIETVNIVNKTKRGSISQPIKILTSPPSEMKISSVKTLLRDIIIEWSVPSSGIESVERYSITRINSKTGEEELIGELSSNINRFTDKTAMNGTSYRYVVSASNKFGLTKTEKSEEVYLPLVLNPFSIEVIKSDYPIIKWEPFDEGYEIRKIEIYRGETKENLKIIAELSDKSNNYVDKSLLSAKEYYYQVKIVNKLNEEQLSVNLPSITSSGIDTADWKNKTNKLVMSDPQIFIHSLKKALIDVPINDNSPEGLIIKKIITLLKESGDIE